MDEGLSEIMSVFWHAELLEGLLNGLDLLLVVDHDIFISITVSLLNAMHKWLIVLWNL